MANVFNMNQFKKKDIVGVLDLNAGGLNTSFSVRIDPDSSAEDIKAGTGLVFVDGGANDPGTGLPIVDVVSDDATMLSGARVYDLQKGLAQPGDIVQMSFKGCIQKLEAAAAINRNLPVTLVNATAGTFKAVGTDAQFGITLDKATAAGDIIRIIVDPAAAST